jgi:hypothetical protein
MPASGFTLSYPGLARLGVQQASDILLPTASDLMPHCKLLRV